MYCLLLINASEHAYLILTNKILLWSVTFVSCNCNFTYHSDYKCNNLNVFLILNFVLFLIKQCFIFNSKVEHTHLYMYVY